MSLTAALMLIVSATHTVKASNHIFKLFSPSGSHTILVFLYQTLWQYYDGTPLTRASNAGVWKNCSFRPIYHFILEMIQDRAIVLWNANSNSYAIYRMVPFPMILSDVLWLGEIFNDAKHRTASELLSFLFFFGNSLFTLSLHCALLVGCQWGHLAIKLFLKW